MGNHFAAEVHLEHEVYYPGNVVRGEATIKVDKATPCIAARITCRGLERAVVVKCGTDATQKSMYEDTVFYQETLTLFGHPTKDPDITPVEIPPGVYTYPFAFRLPMQLPESFHAADWSQGGGEVQYHVITYAKMSAHVIDESHHSFTVVVPINRKDQLSSPPVRGTATAVLTRQFARKGECEFTVSLPHTIYAADDTIEGEIAVDNTSGQMDIDHVRVSLRLHCDASISEACSGVEDGLRGSSKAKPLICRVVPLPVRAGKTKAVPLRIHLPHTLPSVSYPAHGCRVVLVHMLAVELARDVIELPIYIAHCADEENRFAFCPVDEPTHKPEYRDTEHAYAVPEGYAASPCEALAPPATLDPPPSLRALTPQAVGNGQMHAEH